MHARSSLSASAGTSVRRRRCAPFMMPPVRRDGESALLRSGERVTRRASDEFRPKPRLWLQPQTVFVSARGSLPQTPAVEILKLSRLQSPAGALLYARAAASAFYELVGPPTASGVREIVDELGSLAETVIVDGAVDRVASLAGSDGAVIVACGAAAAKTIEEAVDEAAALVARLSVPRLDAQAPVIELQGALTASQAAQFIAAARKASNRRPRSDADRSEREGRIACSGPTAGSLPPPVARHRRDDRVNWARAQLRTASLCNCRRKGDGFAGLRRLRRHARRVKALELLDPASAHVLGFEWLKKAVAPISPYGERHFSELRPFVAGEEAQAEKRAKEIASVADGLHAADFNAVRGALGNLPDVSGAIARASMGDVLDDPSFLELRRFCALIDRIDGLVCALSFRPRIANDAVRAVDEALAIGGRKEEGFYLADEFDAELATARYRLAREQAELDAARGRERERAARALERDEIVGDEFIVMRADMRSPLPAGIRVVREAPTYLLCALEYGASLLEALARRDAAADEVAAAEQRLRSRLSRHRARACIRPCPRRACARRARRTSSRRAFRSNTPLHAGHRDNANGARV